MKTIQGKLSCELDFNKLKDLLANYNHIVLDLGTGDGRYVRTLANKHPDRFFIGLDACRENLQEHSRAKLANMLFLIASAQALPNEISGLISHITINFPWGSLLEGLLASDPGLMRGLSTVSGPHAKVEIRLNGGALAEAGRDLESGTEIIYQNMILDGWDLKRPQFMDAGALTKFPTTWAKRLAHGRDPRAICLSGQRN